MYLYVVASDSYRVQSDSNMVNSYLHGWLEPKCGLKLTSDSYRVQSDSNMVKSDLHGWLEPKCGLKLTRINVVPRGG